jgi:hypothetical protein
MMEEKHRYYRAVSKPIAHGENRGKRVVFTHRNDSLVLARGHVEQCFGSTEYGRLEIDRLNFIGTQCPEGLGLFHLVERAD